MSTNTNESDIELFKQYQTTKILDENGRVIKSDLKLRNNLADIDQDKSFGNHIKPGELSTRQKQLLKEAFWAVSELKKTMTLGGMSSTL
jgi:signal-transduction protein with cAMP-binding, CBS, and nucleotidyltransferase domain